MLWSRAQAEQQLDLVVIDEVALLGAGLALVLGQVQAVQACGRGGRRRGGTGSRAGARLLRDNRGWMLRRWRRQRRRCGWMVLLLLLHGERSIVGVARLRRRRLRGQTAAALLLEAPRHVQQPVVVGGGPRGAGRVEAARTLLLLLVLLVRRRLQRVRVMVDGVRMRHGEQVAAAAAGTVGGEVRLQFGGRWIGVSLVELDFVKGGRADLMGFRCGAEAET